MKHNSSRHHRRSIRLRGYDYSAAGAYFITINVQDRFCLFGAVDENGVRLNDIGKIARKCWEDIPIHFSNVELDEFVIMPNHMHGIILILPDDGDRWGVPEYKDCGGVQLNAPTENAPTRKDNYYSNISPRKKSLSVIVRTYKAAVTTICRKNGFRHFKWQRNYYERIIRSDGALNRVRKYVINNPVNWRLDKEKFG